MVQNTVLPACVVGCFRVRLVERGAPQSLPLMESGKVGYIMCITSCVNCKIFDQTCSQSNFLIISRYCQVLG